MSKILVVDDDLDMVEMIRVTLEAKGHTVVSAHNRLDGMAAVESESPDLLIQDVMMTDPDDGITMVQDLKRNGFKKPIIMLSSINEVTGFSYERDDEMIPCDIFIHKPAKPETLIEKVSELLG
ncbi:MAG: response regulator [Fibrobacterales bacterium]